MSLGFLGAHFRHLLSKGFVVCPYLCICFSPLSSFHFEFLSFLSAGEFFLLHCVFYTHSVVFLSQSFLEFVKRGHLSKIHSNFCVCECVCMCVCVCIYIIECVIKNIL